MRSLLAELVLVELVLVACAQMNPGLENVDKILEDSVRIFSYRKYEAPELASLAGLDEMDPMELEWNKKTRNSDLDVIKEPEEHKTVNDCLRANKGLPKPPEPPKISQPPKTPEPPKPKDVVKNGTTKQNLAPELRVMPNVYKPELRQYPTGNGPQKTSNPQVQYIPFLMTAPIPVHMPSGK